MRTALFRCAAAAAFLVAGGPVHAQTESWPIESPPPPLLAPDVVFPPYELRTLENGLQIVYVGAFEQPAVNVRLLVRAGASSDAGAAAGLAELAAQLLDQGTSRQSAQEIAQTIDNTGGALSVGAGADLSFVNLLVLKDRFDLALDMLADLVQRPAYAEDEINRQRQQLLSGMRVSYDDPTYIASVVFGRLVYGEHPYGVPQNGTPASLQTITRSDLVDFHDVHYLPNNAILAIVGDVSAEEAFAGAERALADWRRGPEPPAAAIELPPPAARLIVVDKPGAVQTTVWVGHRALPRGHPDFLTLDVAIKILGGEGGNRLGGVLRTQRSLTYSASAETAARRFGGDVLAKTDTRSDATAEVLRLTVDEIARLRRDRVSDRELENAIAYLAGNFPLTIETPNAIASRVLEARLYGLDLDAIETYPERVRAVTPRDIQRVAREHLHPDRLAIVLVGDARAFVGDLAGVGFDEFEVVPLAEFEVGAPGFRRRSALAPAR